MLTKTAFNQVCSTRGVTPECLRTLYGTIDYDAQVPERNSMGVVNLRCSLSSSSDIKTFLRTYRPEAETAADNLTTIHINGCPQNKSATLPADATEAALDVQTSLGIGWPTPLTVWSTNTAPYWSHIPDYNTFSIWLDYLLQQDSIPRVISISYGHAESVYSRDSAYAMCSKYAQLAARGVSVLVGSGDYGVAGITANYSCRPGTKQDYYAHVPTFPSTCPYVTSVGGTEGFVSERAAYNPSTQYTSGGGFSRYFTRPTFQDEAVTPYADAFGHRNHGLWNSSGRAYPDISAHSRNFSIVLNGTFEGTGGTSASAPTVAAVISLLKDAQIAAGQRPLGWLNPWLYGKCGAAFSDVTKGWNLGCNFTLGFDAAKG